MTTASDGGSGDGVGRPPGVRIGAVLSRGVWRLRREIEVTTGLALVYHGGLFRRPTFDCVVGWGMRPSAMKARAFAERHRVPFVSVEDGWLRSIEPGQASKPLSMVADWRGVHFDARCSSDLEAIIARSAECHDGARMTRARAAIALLRQRRLSKYNHAPALDPAEMGLPPGRRRVLVVDQTAGDMSIVGGLADASTFAAMMEWAIAEANGAEIVVKTHPETTLGRKRGYLTSTAGAQLTRCDAAVNPWVLIEAVDTVYTVSSQLGFEALMAGRRVVCCGAPYYAGWGLTEDRVALPRRRARPTLEQLFAALYFDYARYLHPQSGEATTLEVVADWLDRSRPAGA